MATEHKKIEHLSLKDRLSHLNYTRACQVLGTQGPKLLSQGRKFNIGQEQVMLTDHAYTIRFGEELANPIVATIRKANTAREWLQAACSHCQDACEHVGAALQFALNEKTLLGLAKPPEEEKDIPLEKTAEEREQQALLERTERAAEQKMSIRSTDPARLWTDYLVTNRTSGNSYRVAIRGWLAGESYCSCPDFRTNTLGTCKHVLHVLSKMKRKFAGSPQLKQQYIPDRWTLHLTYGARIELHLQKPARLTPALAKLIAPYLQREPLTSQDAVALLEKLESAGVAVTVYPDAEEYIQQELFRSRIRNKTEQIRKNPAQHPLRKALLKTELLPYQLDGIAFAVGAGRAILADEMGLGKTIQGVGVAELLAQEVGIKKVLVVTPASLKSQWCTEITKFCGRSHQQVLGSTASRTSQYQNDSFFTICNYEQVLRDILAIEKTPWDLIILDEAQRIKNWQSKTTRVIKALKSRFALVLTGTPLENRLEELYSIVEFIDDRRLGPTFHFFHEHRQVDEKGKILGYRNLAVLRERLRPVLLRRTRESVAQQLPGRTNEIVRITPTDEQLELHRGQMQIVLSIVNKPFISEMDLLRLRKALLLARMSADGTMLVDKQLPGYSSKLEKLDELLESLSAEPDRKIIIFSEWTTMLDQIQPLLQKHGFGYVRLDGKVPQKKRQNLVHSFQNNPQCRVFMATNAGATGLNLQAANTVINVDLPWNPAVLEQRIGRAYRMGQKRKVHVYILVTDGTIEENLLLTLTLKHELAQAALDVESETDSISLGNNMENLKKRLEVLLGAKPEASLDESRRIEEQRHLELVQKRKRVESAGGQLLTSAIAFLGELMPSAPQPQSDAFQAIQAQCQAQLQQCVTTDEQGQIKLTLNLPNAEALQQMAAVFAQLAMTGNPGGNLSQTGSTA